MFSVDHAVRYGVSEAVIIQNLQFWIVRNRANGENFREGRTWTYNSVKAFSDLFPYMSPKQIRGALERLVEKGVLVTANHNESGRDRTLWYAFADEGHFLDGQLSHLPSGANAIAAQGNSHLPSGANAIASRGKSLIRADVTTDKNPDSARGSRLPKDWTLLKAWGEEAMRVDPTWTPEHVRFEAEKFRDYWVGVAGKAGVKLDWLATWRNWVRNAGPMAAEKKGGGAWWLSPESRKAKAHEVGVGDPLRGESDATYQARIQAAIDNGGKPPAPRPQPVTPLDPVPVAEAERTGPSETSRASVAAAMTLLKQRNAGLSYDHNAHGV